MKDPLGQDCSPYIIVLPEFQRKGVGTVIMTEIEKYLQNKAGDNSFVGLMAAKGVKEFYLRFGYTERSQDRPGMSKIIRK